jgi:GT2 family glycosyltransferase
LEAYLPSVLAAVELHRRKNQAGAEVVVVDDGSQDETPAWLRAQFPNQLLILEHANNLGFAAACHTGFRAARYPVVLLLNNDVRLKDDCIAPMLEHFADPRVFAVTGRMFNQRGDIFCNGGKVARFRRGMWSTYENYDLLPWVQPDLSMLSFTAVGAFSSYDRAKFLELGGFDPLLFLVEDVEISYRAWKQGWFVKYEPRSVAYHDASQTIDRHFDKWHVDRLARRNRILMHWMLLHDSGMFRRHLLALLGRFLISWLALDWRFYWGIFTGLRNLGRILDRRRETRRLLVRTDRELLELFERFYRTAPIALRKV